MSTDEPRSNFSGLRTIPKRSSNSNCCWYSIFFESACSSHTTSEYSLHFSFSDESLFQFCFQMRVNLLWTTSYQNPSLTLSSSSLLGYALTNSLSRLLGLRSSCELYFSFPSLCSAWQSWRKQSSSILWHFIPSCYCLLWAGFTRLWEKSYLWWRCCSCSGWDIWLSLVGSGHGGHGWKIWKYGFSDSLLLLACFCIECIINVASTGIGVVRL